MNPRTLILTLLGLVGMAAQAQGEPSWTGFHVGLGLDKAIIRSEWTDNSYDWFGGALSHPRSKTAPSLELGYDWQAGNVVYGFAADHTFLAAKQVVPYGFAVTDPSPVLMTDDVKSTSTLRGRMGLRTGNALVYVTAGLARVVADHTWVNPNDARYNFSVSCAHTGLVMGVGLEHRVSEHFSFKAELLQTEVPASMTLDGFQGLWAVSETLHSFRLAASYRF